MADDQALQGQLPHLANGGRGRSQLLPYQPHGFTGPEMERGGKMREKGRRKGYTRKTLILVPLYFRVLFSGLPTSLLDSRFAILCCLGQGPQGRA